MDNRLKKNFCISCILLVNSSGVNGIMAEEKVNVFDKWLRSEEHHQNSLSFIKKKINLFFWHNPIHPTTSNALLRFQLALTFNILNFNRRNKRKHVYFRFCKKLFWYTWLYFWKGCLRWPWRESMELMFGNHQVQVNCCYICLNFNQRKKKENMSILDVAKNYSNIYDCFFLFVFLKGCGLPVSRWSFGDDVWHPSL